MRQAIREESLLRRMERRLEREERARKEAEEIAERSTRELYLLVQELEQFSYVASHDLQEPLRMITNYLQLLQRRYGERLDADADEFIGFAVEGAVRMQQLINDLLVLSRVGMRGRPFERTDLEMVLGRTLANLQIAIAEAGATVSHGPLPVLLADPSQMGQLFQNLLSNAIKFRSDVPSRINVSAERAENEWVISVADNGIGIEPRYRERIFQVFRRLHTQSEYSGTGIGLAICKKIVERHRGRIWIESAPGGGSKLRFTIPLEEENQ